MTEIQRIELEQGLQTTLARHNEATLARLLSTAADKSISRRKRSKILQTILHEHAATIDAIQTRYERLVASTTQFEADASRETGSVPLNVDPKTDKPS